MKRTLLTKAPTTPQPQPAGTTSQAAFQVLMRKKQSFNKKHKSWDDDGILVVKGSESAVMYSMEGKEIGKSQKFNLSNDPFDETVYSLGGKEIQISNAIAWESYTSGMPSTSLNPPLQLSTRIQPRPLVAFGNPKPLSGSTGKFKAPSFIGGGGSTPVTKEIVVKPRHDASAPGAIVLKRPFAPKGRHIVDVVVDPFLASSLRPHQVEGVSFLYECVMGLKGFNGNGAILADEMGLGKTLQSITLIWTLLKQSPIANAPPPVKRALIVCPATLCQNWKREFGKWLGEERIRVFVLEDKTNIKDFTVGKVHSVLICGYERLRVCKDDILSAGFDIVIADEGHRLKNKQIQASQIISALNTKRRVILSGTPIQNDLGEFHSMCDLVNPGILGNRSTFTSVYENPILAARDPKATQEDIDLGAERSQELAKITQDFILRRTSAIFMEGGSAGKLPPKTEITLFIRMSEVQQSLYQHVVGHSLVKRVIGSGDSVGSGKNVLGYITLLKKLVNSAALMNEDSVSASDLGVKDYLDSKFEMGQLSCFELSSKLETLNAILRQIKETTNEKVVVISNWTQTLDLVQDLLTQNEMTFLRLDGQTDSSKRQNLVDRFNTSTSTSSFCFLLSAKAGGMGLNLIGASRLFLLDIDWNPAICLQAMARIWREGQKKPVKIYRFLTTGSVEERIFQRQISKMGLSDSLLDSGDATGNAGSKFSKEELKDLFSYDAEVDCLAIQIREEEVRERVMNGFSNFALSRDGSRIVDQVMQVDSMLGTCFERGELKNASYCLVRK
ncbi:helicase [Podochytrium sp. JEL0797]|nr:helicase [Podochytrium sp. JEL0797]